jgi:hypothetical protein
MEPDRDEETTQVMSGSSSSSLPSTPRAATGLGLTTATFPQIDNLPPNSYDVALNALVETSSSSPPISPRSTLSESHSSLPESLRELTSNKPPTNQTSTYHGRLQFDKMDDLLDGIKNQRVLT